MSTKLFQQIDTYADIAIDLQYNLIAMPALSPANGGEGEFDKASFLADYLQNNCHFDRIKLVKAPDTRAKGGYRPNIIARYNGEGDRTVWFVAHTDIVPPGELSLWSTSPYMMKVDGNKIYGRGAEDNHQGICSTILAAKAFMDLEVRPPCNLGLLLVADEETGSEYGINYLLENCADVLQFSERDVFIVPNGGNQKGDTIEIAEKSTLWLRFHTEGKQCHACLPSKGINSFKAASALVVRLQELYRIFADTDPVFDLPSSTFEPTRKEANVGNVNTIPGEDVFYMDCRVLPRYDLEQVKTEVRKICNGVEKEYGVKITFDSCLEEVAPVPTPKNAPLVAIASAAIEKVYGFKAKTQGIGYKTLASFVRKLGFHAIVYSRIEEMAHHPDEYCLLDNVLADAKVFVEIVLNCK